MAKDERAAGIMRDRRAILATLNMCFPGSMPGEELFRLLLDVNPEYTRTLMIRDMKYLNEKGYVGFRGAYGIEAMQMTVRDCLFFLTAKGTDVANRLVDDTTLQV